MSMDSIGDMLTSIRNANQRYLEKVDVPASKIKEQILKVLKEEGYISGYKKIEDNKQGIIRIYLKYGPEKEKVIKEIKRVSKPGCRIYIKWNEIRNIYGSFGIGIFSTSKGIMSNKKARERHLGGEFICKVW